LLTAKFPAWLAVNLMRRRAGVSVMTVRWSMRPSTYDRMMRGSNQRRYFGDSGYFNFGYWGAGAKSQREASEALVDQMVARIANRNRPDSACGLRTRGFYQAFDADLCARDDYRH
jgi:hypothetical protein